MPNFLDTLLSSIAPHDCVACSTTGALLCENCIDLLPNTLSRCYRCGKATQGYTTCKTCLSTSPLDAVFVCTDYETVAKSLVQKLKFHRVFAGGHTIARVMALQLVTELPKDATLTFVPTATSRVRQRGYDQSRLIAQELAKQTGLQYVDGFFRLGQQRQTSSSRKDRLAQMKDAFVVRRTIKQAPHVLLVDDVMTTGSTLEAAARALKSAGVPKVSAAVFARAT